MSDKMQNSNFEAERKDFATLLRKEIQIAMSKFAYTMGLRRFDPEDFKIEYLDIDAPKLPRVFHNYRVVHVSDIHYDQWISSDRLEGIVDLINKNKPDLIAITGDFVSYVVDDSIEEEMVSKLKRLRANDAIVAVLGNHDHWSGARRVHKILKESNIHDISNDIYIVQKNGESLTIAGIDSAMMKKDRMDIVLKKIPGESPAILLAHEPDFAVKSSATKRFILQLSGHSHGGQFIIPGLGTPFRGPLFKKYPHGKYQIGDMIHYTNRGLGTNGYWLRINCPPEITIINLCES